MKHLFLLQGRSIEVLFDEHAVHITNNKELQQLIAADPEGNTRALAELILQQFEVCNKRSFALHPDSLIVEIWGHVYCEYLAQILDNLVKLQLVKALAGKVIAFCEVIDCGEPGHDSNRVLWDMLAPFTAIIAGWLPGAIKDKVPGS